MRFLSQSVAVMLCTVAVTVCAALLFVYFYGAAKQAPADGGMAAAEVVLLENDALLYQSGAFSGNQIKEMLMNLSVNVNTFTYQGGTYRLRSEGFSANGRRYQLLRLIPVLRLSGYYIPFILFIGIVFVAVFAAASAVVQRRNTRDIIAPIVNLTGETENLRRGELETAIPGGGCGEVGALTGAIEQLRIKLKDSIYYQQRVDDNRKFLISSISHDLKTPVTSIRGYIDGVLDGVADTEEKKRDYLKKAAAKTRLINTMIEDLLLFSKLDLNQMPFKTENTDIARYTQEFVRDNAEDFARERKSICFENTLAEVRYVSIDRDKFKRVLQNIADNAKKNIESGGGTLLVSVRENASSVILEFRDNGIGIKKEALPHIFDRFYRGDSARPAEGSSGLGLAIAKQIVEGLGGRVWAVSKDGGGASVMIALKKRRGSGGAGSNEARIDY
ncbi:MAG: HAMP domain-containing histidine kinase [Clostridiales bacterium]|nr:HAMP domain-containing histidine kinase [Clostridiales bacterium]